jgi:hypothetical protein
MSLNPMLVSGQKMYANPMQDCASNNAILEKSSRCKQRNSIFKFTTLIFPTVRQA